MHLVDVVAINDFFYGGCDLACLDISSSNTNIFSRSGMRRSIDIVILKCWHRRLVIIT